MEPATLNAARVLAAAALVLDVGAAQRDAAVSLSPVQRWPLLATPAGCEAPRWLDDVVAVQRVLPASPADLDLTAHAVLLVPATAVPNGQRLVWGAAAPGDDGYRVELRTAPLADGDRPETGALFLLPRVRPPLLVRLATADAPAWPPVRLPEDPDAGDRLRVLAVRELALPREAVSGRRCARAATAAEWDRLRAGLGLAPGLLPPADLLRCVVVGVRLPAGSMPAPRLDVGTEEGVDVLTLSPARSRRAEDQSPRAVLLVLPRRLRQLTVVLRQPASDQPAADRPDTDHAVETVLGTFAPPE